MTELVDAAFVIASFDDAMATLAALPHAGFSTALAQHQPDIIRTFADLLEESAREDAADDLQTTVNRPSRPDSRKIDVMDEIFGWLAFIPERRFVLRIVVGRRAIRSRVTDKPLSWRRIAEAVHTDHKTVQRWHADGIDFIVNGLNRMMVTGSIPDRISGLYRR